MTPEKLHLALNHFVILLPLAAVLPLAVGLFTRSRPAVLSGLGLALIGSLLTGVVMETGEQAYERYEDGPPAAYLDAGAHEALEHHERIAHRWSKLLYALAGVCGVALLIAFLKPGWLPLLGATTGLLCLAAAAAGIAIADSGGKIRRPDFRAEDAIQPTVDAKGEHPHEADEN